MIDLQTVRANTAGAYIRLAGCYLFAIGIQPYNGRIPVVRLGGHREEHETGWQCAVREVYEETKLSIKPLCPRTTYVSDWDLMEAELQEVRWQPGTEQEPAPLLVVTYSRQEEMHLSLMYLAETQGFPRPSSEVKGLLLLRPEEIHHLCREPVTLEQCLSKGGQAIWNAEFDTKCVLEPFAQLRLLSRILRIHSETKAPEGTA